MDVDVEPADGLSGRGVHLLASDMGAARAELVGRGVEVSGIEDVGRGGRYASFPDPDGNVLLREIPWRTGEAF